MSELAQLLAVISITCALSALFFWVVARIKENDKINAKILTESDMQGPIDSKWKFPEDTKRKYKAYDPAKDKLRELEGLEESYFGSERDDDEPML